MLFHYFTTLKMNYATDSMEEAVLMEDISLDRHDSIERERSFYLEKEICYLEQPLMLIDSEYKDLMDLLSDTPKIGVFRGGSKAYWTKLLENSQHKTTKL